MPDDTLKARIDEELKDAMRKGRAVTVSTLRLLRSAIKNAEIEMRSECSDEDVTKLIAREVKKRKESIALYEKGGRPEKAEQEQKELKVLMAYLPEQASDDELRAVLARIIAEMNASSAADIGKVMGKAMAELSGKADGADVKRIAAGLLKAS